MEHHGTSEGNGSSGLLPGAKRLATRSAGTKSSSALPGRRCRECGGTGWIARIGLSGVEAFPCLKCGGTGERSEERAERPGNDEGRRAVRRCPLLTG